VTDFSPGELARVKTSHHKVAPKGSIVKIVKQWEGRKPGDWYTRGKWITFAPLVNRGGVEEQYTWDENRFEKL
jgi:hypothetical protein